MTQKKILWRKTSSFLKRGVIVGSNNDLEWLLPWWWHHYSQHNDYPVTFIDFGMSQNAKNWCKERGECIVLPQNDLFNSNEGELDPIIVAKWTKLYGDSSWEKRPVFFKKPFACLETPYRETIWIDLDCEVRCNLEGIFSCISPHGFCISFDRDFSEYPIFNSGVMGFRHKHPLITEWALRSFDIRDQFYGDQDLLSYLIQARHEPMIELSPLYQWSIFYEDNALVRIRHWHGKRGKAELLRQILSSRFEGYFFKRAKI